jgi:cytochrome b561
LDKLGVAAHYILNLTALLIAASGIGLAIISGLPNIVFFGQGTLPESFFDFFPRYVHGISTKVMIALILVHIIGGLYHALIIKDRPFARIWFGKSS